MSFLKGSHASDAAAREDMSGKGEGSRARCCEAAALQRGRGWKIDSSMLYSYRTSAIFADKNSALACGACALL